MKIIRHLLLPSLIDHPLSFFILILAVGPLWASSYFLCAGHQIEHDQRAAKRANNSVPSVETRQGIVIFAKFREENAAQLALPSWSVDIFNIEQPGSFAHFYHTMSFGKMQIRGAVAEGWFESSQDASSYLATESNQRGEFGRFSLDILLRADRSINFARFDNDGPDGMVNSGDDDGYVDIVFINMQSIPANFLLGPATGISELGLEEDFITNDLGIAGEPIRIASRQGTIQQVWHFAQTVGAMCHEYGHVLGLPDLFNAEFIMEGQVSAERDDAGIGKWGLMGWGALGWNGDDGPNSFCAWSRVKVGWAEVEELGHLQEEIRVEDVAVQGAVLKIPLNDQEYYLVENRQRAVNYYDRNIPGEGLLIWHIEEKPGKVGQGPTTVIDLECADGRWLDAGYPIGDQPDSQRGGDNLDFWSRDQAYSIGHGGNQGDATDPFDGIRFSSFTPNTNPDSYSSDRLRNISIENIHFENGLAIGKIRARTVPPRLVVPRIRQISVGVDIMLNDASDGRRHVSENVAATVYDANDTTEIHAISMRWDGNQFKGRWLNAIPGSYLVEVMIESTEGGREKSTLYPFFVTGDDLAATPSSFGPWQHVGPPNVYWTPGVHSLAIAPSDPNMVYAITLNALWRSIDGGSSWTKTDIMLKGDYTAEGNEILVDAQDPLTIYLSSDLLMSRDGGNHWEQLVLPTSEGLETTIPNPINTGRIPDPTRFIIAADPIRSGRLYANIGGVLQISEDGGASWHQGGLAIERNSTIGFIMPHPTQLDLIYAMYLGFSQSVLFQSKDGGKRWQRRDLDQTFRALTLDPRDGNSLYGVDTQMLWHSEDEGLTWREIGPIPADGINKIIAEDSGLLYIWNNRLRTNGFWRSDDRGGSWSFIELSAEGEAESQIVNIVPHPRDPHNIYSILKLPLSRSELYVSENSGDQWDRVILSDAMVPVGTMVFDRAGQLYAGTQNNRMAMIGPGVFVSVDGGLNWTKRTQRTEAFFLSAYFNVLLPDPIQSRFLIGHRRGIYMRSVDFGETWLRIDPLHNPVKYYPEIVADPWHDGIYYIADRSIYRSTDFGKTWVQRSRGLPVRTQIGGLVVASNMADNMYTAIENRVWHSGNSAESWEERGGVNSGQRILSLASHPLRPERLYAATKLGIYVSEDRARSWGLLSEFGVEISSEVRIRFNPIDSDGLYVVAGRHLMESEDGGRTWLGLGADLSAYPWFNDVIVDPLDHSVLFTSTPWGIFRLDKDRVSTAVERAHESLPRVFELKQNYPNPFNAQTAITYRLSHTTGVTLAIYNITGQVLRRLVNEKQNSGEYTVYWDGQDDRGIQVGSGIYLYGLHTENDQEVRRLVLLK